MYRDIIKPTLALIIISVIISALLAVTYNVAGVEKIASAGLSQEKLDKYMPTVLPKATSLKQIDVSVEDKSFLGVYQDEGGSGVAVQVVTKGYGGDMKLLVGIGTDDTVTGVAATESRETPGLGSRAVEPEFLSKFNGINKSVIVEKKGKGDIDAITGSTISSKAVGTGVNKALELYKAVKGELE